jgi:hypothetical protein
MVGLLIRDIPRIDESKVFAAGGQGGYVKKFDAGKCDRPAGIFLLTIETC